VRRPAVSSPHDALFKQTFSRVEHAAGELRTILPPEILARLDLGSLVLQPGTFVDQALSSRHSDLLFSVRLDGRSAFIYILFEHQRKVHPLMLLRLLSYLVRIWEQFLADHPRARQLPAILPLVLHHSEHGWHTATKFEQILDLDPGTLAVIRKYVPGFEFMLDDLSHERDEALRARAMTALGRLVLWCLRHADTPDEIVRRIAGWLDLVSEVRRAPDGAAALATVWRYVVAISGRRGPKRVLRRLIAAVDQDTQEELMSIADYLHEKGRREGRQEGRREGKQEGQRRTLTRQLTARFGPLPEDAVVRIRAATTVQLDRWAERVLTAPTLEAVLGSGRAAGSRRGAP
jgi:predicted transposase YdaD